MAKLVSLVGICPQIVAPQGFTLVGIVSRYVGYHGDTISMAAGEVFPVAVAMPPYREDEAGEYIPDLVFMKIVDGCEITHDDSSEYSYHGWKAMVENLAAQGFTMKFWFDGQWVEDVQVFLDCLDTTGHGHND